MTSLLNIYWTSHKAPDPSSLDRKSYKQDTLQTIQKEKSASLTKVNPKTFTSIPQMCFVKFQLEIACKRK